MSESYNITKDSGCSSMDCEHEPASATVNLNLSSNANGHSSLCKIYQVDTFVYSEDDLILAGPLSYEDRFSGAEMTSLSRFDHKLRTNWMEKMKLGLFRYNLGDLQTRILPGAFGFVAQLNIKRGLERRKPQDIQSIQQEFDPQQFNFNKIQFGEILFQIIKKDQHINCQVELDGSNSSKTFPLKMASTSENGILDDDPNKASTLSKSWKTNGILAVINVSPLEFGHVLFIPDPALCLPQILTPDLIQFGIEFVLLSAHQGFRVGFNSLGGFASVNHLHLHGFYLAHKLFIESACTEPLCPENNFHLLSDFPARGFLFYTDGSSLEKLVHDIHKVTDYLVSRNIAHNLFVTRGCGPGNPVNPESKTGIRIIVWARKACFGAKEETAFNVALCELAGHLPIKTSEDYYNITETYAVSIVQKYLLPEEALSQLTAELVEILSK